MELQAGAGHRPAVLGAGGAISGAAASIRNAPPSVLQTPEGTERDWEHPQSGGNRALTKVAS